MQAQVLAPAAVLVLWSLFMLVWMEAIRFPAMIRSGLDLKAAKPGARGQDLEGVLPARVQWKAHNYNHLMEQPTIYYAAVMILALTGAQLIDVRLAWAYTILRILHSLWQSLVNGMPVRFVLFVLSTFVLIALSVRAVVVTF